MGEILLALISGCSIVATSGIRAEEHGVVSVLLNTAQQVGIAVGVAALVTVAAARTAALADAGPAAAVEGYRLGLLVSAGVAAAGALIVLASPQRAPLPALDATKRG